ncbi:MAG: DNA repair protein RecO [Cytophagaceae bacterium]|nr:DNA repair protein RecO [Cytophagaceae bacterium]
MLQKTRGVVLNYIKYRETSIITKIYTEEFGLRTYIVNGVRSKNSKNKIGLFQSLTILDLVVYYKENSSIKRISEIKCTFPFKSIPFEVKKSSIALFISEILNKTLKEETSNQELFYFLHKSLIYLDEIKEDFQNFHLQFLIQLSSFLGFFPTSIKDILGDEASMLKEEEKEMFEKLLRADYTETIKLNNGLRRFFLAQLLRFYKNHIENFGEINSEKILKEVLS